MAIANKDLSGAFDRTRRFWKRVSRRSWRERATYGMARVKETQGDLDAATKYYSDLVAKWPNGTFTAAAKQRLEDFKQPDMKLHVRRSSHV